MNAHFGGSNEHMETSSGAITVELARRLSPRMRCYNGWRVRGQPRVGDVIMSNGMSMDMLDMQNAEWMRSPKQ